ncbi:SEC-C domain-containing protein [Tepidanaerobacter acetatoxydans]|uniref:SEC-C domain-containing protein n=1 Tax=Tepidanaerobacter acetatoxydans TaxID=499229 RepID=UPI001BD4E47D|nr:SEC-C domain-containing protein [Tepidanaerobacter acetatoxydans]
MSDVFDIQRNEECICGSDKKYKKCCLPAVEKIETELMRKLSDDFRITAYAKDLIRVISVMFGVKFDEAKAEAVDVEKLSNIIAQVLSAQEEFSEDSFLKLNNDIVDMLRENENLKIFRLPGSILAHMELDDSEQVDMLLSQIADNFSMEENLFALAYLIRNNHFTDDELEKILHWIFMGIIDETYQSFFELILQVSIEDISEAGKKFEQIIKEEDETARQVDIAEIHELFREYPVFEDYFGVHMLENVKDDLEFILKSEIDFKFQFFLIYGFFLKLTSAITQMFIQNLPYADINKELNFMDMLMDVGPEFLKQEVIITESYGCITRTLIETMEKSKDKDLQEKLAKVAEFFLLPTEAHLLAIEEIILTSMKKFLENLPQAIDDSPIVLKSIEQLITDEFFDEYISYLESKGLNEQAEFLKEIYNETNIKCQIEKAGLKEIFDNLGLKLDKSEA